MPVLTEIKHFETCNQGSGLEAALQIAKIEHCVINLAIGVSGSGCISMRISADDTIENLRIRLKQGLEIAEQNIKRGKAPSNSV